MPVLCAVRKWLWNTGRWARWSMKVNGEPVLCAVRKWLWNAAGMWAPWSTKLNGEPALCAARKWLWNAGRWARWSTKVKGETVYCVQWENGYGMQAGEHSGARSWTMKLVDSGRVLNGAPQFVGRPTSAGCGRADRRDFLPARFCRRSPADLLLERQSAALLPSCARPVYCCTKITKKIIKPPNQNHCCFLFSEKVGISCWWRLIIDLEILRQEAFLQKTKSSSASSYPKFGIFFFFFFISHWILFLLVSRMSLYQKTPHWERFLSAGFFGVLWRGGRGRGGAGLCCFLSLLLSLGDPSLGFVEIWSRSIGTQLQ